MGNGAAMEADELSQPRIATEIREAGVRAHQRDEAAHPPSPCAPFWQDEIATCSSDGMSSETTRPENPNQKLTRETLIQNR
jgi:hypothetical protein